MCLQKSDIQIDKKKKHLVLAKASLVQRQNKNSSQKINSNVSIDFAHTNKIIFI